MLASGLGLALLALAALIMLVRNYPVATIAVLVALFAASQLLRRRSAAELRAERARAFACLEQEIERYRNALLSYFRQSIREDLFGNEDTILWRRHIGIFLEKQVLPELKAAAVRVDDSLIAELAGRVDLLVRAASAEPPAGAPSIDSSKLTPLEYEAHCAAMLAGCGWEVRRTPATGDRGADVIAEKHGQRLVVQCKLYAQPVGNKAVQEIYSARPIYGAGHACVVAPAGFTAQAERDAHALSVRLLHHSDLRKFADDLARMAAPASPPGALARAG